MPRRLTILHALEKSHLTTGSVVQMVEAARGLAVRGHRVTIAAPPGGDIEAACAAAGIDHLAIPLGSSFDFGSAATLRRHLQQRPVDVIHTHKGRAHSVALLAAAGRGRRPVLVANRGVTFPLDHFNRWKYRHPRVGAVVCVAEAVRRVTIQSGRLPAHKVRVIHGGTDTARFDPTTVDGAGVRAELGVAPDTLLVGQVSVRDWKGWRELVAAFSTAASTTRHARLLLVGCEPDFARREVAVAACSVGEAERVIALPFRRDMPEVLAACDVVVDASWAGTGITGTVREAMALGRPVLATDCGGNSELVIDGECGLVVPPRNIDALAVALGRLLEDPALRARLAAAARRRVLAGFTTEHRVCRLEALYHELMGARQSGRARHEP